MKHPNVVDENRICATILDEYETYAPAITLNTLAIQLLGLFSAHYHAQDHDFDDDAEDYVYPDHDVVPVKFRCQKCAFDTTSPDGGRTLGSGTYGLDGLSLTHYTSIPQPAANTKADTGIPNWGEPETVCRGINAIRMLSLPDEILLQILGNLEVPGINALSSAYPRVRAIVQTHDFMRTRELQCFVLRESFLNLKLGIGVKLPSSKTTFHVSEFFTSEFDLISEEGFRDYDQRRSAEGVPFTHWLPLPLSRRHWRSVCEDAKRSIRTIATDGALRPDTELMILSRFLSDIIAESTKESNPFRTYHGVDRYASSVMVRSRLHRSTKAFEGFIAIFHLLICLACEDPTIIAQADTMVSAFLDGGTSKEACPDLGMLLVVSSVSTSGLNSSLMRAVLNEAIKRNVFWVLDKKGSNKSELGYLEPDPISRYRLQYTFDASRANYRFYMFCHFFILTARPDQTHCLTQVRDGLFDRHGAPPAETAENVLEHAWRIEYIDSFDALMKELGIEDRPDEKEMTEFLRQSVRDSVASGYHQMPYLQHKFYALRRDAESGVGVAEGINVSMRRPQGPLASFRVTSVTKKRNRIGL